jgi:hypothetical protein
MRSSRGLGERERYSTEIMSKMLCRCGHSISDSVCPCPTEAHIIGDVAYESFDNAFTRRVDAFLAAVRSGERREWINKEFSTQYPQDDTDGEIISTILSSMLLDYCLSVAECPRCGRLWLQRKIGVNDYRPFSPDEDGFGAHLAVIPKSKTNDGG